MKIEKHGTKYRVRKMYKGVTFIVDFDYEPDEKDVFIAVARKLEEESGGVKGSFRWFADKYIENRRNVVSPSTIRTYNTKLNQLSDGFKDMNIYDISQEVIQAEINRLSKKLEPKTVKTTYGFITAVLGANRSIGKLKIKLPQALKKDVYEPTNNDIQRILKEVKDSDYSVAFQLGVWGCREGEIAALTIDDLDGNNLHIHRTMVMDENNQWQIKDTPKTDESNRILPLPQELADEIRKQGFIFDKVPNRLNKKIHDVQRKLNIPSFRFHTLRSYFASYAHSLGIPDSDILSLGGWRTDNIMKQVYRKSIKESKEQSVQKIAKNLYKQRNKGKNKRG